MKEKRARQMEALKPLDCWALAPMAGVNEDGWNHYGGRTCWCRDETKMEHELCFAQ